MLEEIKRLQAEAHNENLKVIVDAGCTMEKSISGYWRLIGPKEELLHDDSACEDVYDEESAAYIFAEQIKATEYYIIQDREAGNYIDSFDSYEESLQELHQYEETDKKEGTYTPYFYEIVKIW